MSQDSDSKSKPFQTKNDKAPPSKTTTRHLKLVVSNPVHVQTGSNASRPTTSNVGFSVKVCSRGHNLYEMTIQDPFHDLGCNLVLEIEQSSDETTVVCHFPVFLNESNKFLDEDETLYGIIVVQFQMYVLEQLFIFCANRNASQLTIYMDDAQAEGFEIYHDFLSHYDETLTENGEQTEMVIPTDRETFNQWLAFMAEMNLKFEQDLWREQRFSPAIRHYLKSRPRS